MAQDRKISQLADLAAGSFDADTRFPVYASGTKGANADVVMGGLERLKGVHVVTDPIYGAVGDGTTDDTTAIQAAIDAAELAAGVLYFPPGDYCVSAALTIDSRIHVYGPLARIVATVDIPTALVTVTGAAASKWTWDGLWLATKVDTTGYAFKVGQGATRYDARNWGIDYAGGQFANGLDHGGAIIGRWYSPFINPFAVDSTAGTDMYFYDGTGVGTSVPNAIAIYAPDVGAGKYGIRIANSDNFLISGGTVENNVYQRAIWLEQCTRVKVENVEIETPDATTRAVYMDTCSHCVVENSITTSPIELVGCTGIAIKDQHRLNLIADAATTDTKVYGGSIDGGGVAVGLTQEMGVRTLLLGVDYGNGGNGVQYRDGGIAQMQMFGQVGSMAQVQWTNPATGTPDAVLSRGGAGVVRTTGTFQADTGLRAGAGTTVITQFKVYTPSLTPSSVSAQSVAEQTFTVSGLTTADKVIVNPPSIGNATGIVGARVSAADTLAVRFVNPTAGALTPTAGTYTVLAVRS